MDLSEAVDNNYKNVYLKSAVPDECKSEECMLGIDEAGRGPVLGAMVYAAAYCPVTKSDELKSLGVDDSKVLTEKKREELFTVVDNYAPAGWLITVLSPNFISNNMMKRVKNNLNAISHTAAINLIADAINDGVNLTEVYVDTVGPPETYQQMLLKRFPSLKITVAKKADSLFPIVSAASICAKVARDRTVTQWKFGENIELADDQSTGSGYPADPETKKFMESSFDPVFGFPQMVRFSWSTADKIIQSKGVKVLWEEEEDENKPPSVMNYFSHKAQSAKPRHHYFTERNLKPVTTL